MKKKSSFPMLALAVTVLLFSQCAQSDSQENAEKKPTFSGYENQVKWGEHLITVGGCGDCHTPKKMTPMGPVDDSALMLSGHPAQQPIADVDRASFESKGLVVTQTLTFWIGPWGVSYAANLTPDSTGILAWSEEQFIYSLRNGISKGISGNRPLLPPMPWPVAKHFTDDELKAMFAYLKTIKPVKNVVPQPLPPASAPPPTTASK